MKFSHRSLITKENIEVFSENTQELVKQFNKKNNLYLRASGKTKDKLEKELLLDDGELYEILFDELDDLISEESIVTSSEFLKLTKDTYKELIKIFPELLEKVKNGTFHGYASSENSLLKYSLINKKDTGYEIEVIQYDKSKKEEISFEIQVNTKNKTAQAIQRKWSDFRRMEHSHDKEPLSIDDISKENLYYLMTYSLNHWLTYYVDDEVYVESAKKNYKFPHAKSETEIKNKALLTKLHKAHGEDTLWYKSDLITNGLEDVTFNTSSIKVGDFTLEQPTFEFRKRYYIRKRKPEA